MAIKKPFDQWNDNDFAEAEAAAKKKKETTGGVVDGLNFYSAGDGDANAQTAFDVFRQEHPELDEPRAKALYAREQGNSYMQKVVEPQNSIIPGLPKKRRTFIQWLKGE
ncbi:MAG: hypothetical protein WC069_05340 [Candidatus Shapirobacteria bacterium]